MAIFFVSSLTRIYQALGMFSINLIACQEKNKNKQVLIFYQDGLQSRAESFHVS